MSPQTIHKHSISLSKGIQRLKLASSVRLLKTDFQHRDLVLWEQHSVDDKELVAVEFLVVPTGNVFGQTTWNYLGTAMTTGDCFVVHVYWRAI